VEDVNKLLSNVPVRKYVIGKHHVQFIFETPFLYELDLIIDFCISKGSHHFSITIDFPSTDTCGNINGYEEFSEELYKILEEDLNKSLIMVYPTITFILFTNEKNNLGELRIRYLIGIRNFIDYSYCLEQSLLKFVGEHSPSF